MELDEELTGEQEPQGQETEAQRFARIAAKHRTAGPGDSEAARFERLRAKRDSTNAADSTSGASGVDLAPLSEVKPSTSFDNVLTRRPLFDTGGNIDLNAPPPKPPTIDNALIRSVPTKGSTAPTPDGSRRTMRVPKDFQQYKPPESEDAYRARLAAASTEVSDEFEPPAPFKRAPSNAPPATWAQTYGMDDASLFGRAANALGDMVEHPVKTAAGIIWTPIKALKTLATFSAEQDAENVIAMNGGEIGTVERTVKPKDAAIAAAQLGSLALSGPASKLVGGVVAPFLGPRIGAVVGAGAAGAGAGAAFSPDDPAVGALLGGGLGAAHAAVSGARAPALRYGRDVPEGANLGNFPDRLLPERAQPARATATGRVVDTQVPPTEAPYVTPTIEQTLAELREQLGIPKPTEAAPAPAPIVRATSEPVAPVAEPVAVEAPPPVTVPSAVAPSPAAPPITSLIEQLRQAFIEHAKIPRGGVSASAPPIEKKGQEAVPDSELRDWWDVAIGLRNGPQAAAGSRRIAMNQFAGQYDPSMLLASYDDLSPEQKAIVRRAREGADAFVRRVDMKASVPEPIASTVGTPSAPSPTPLVDQLRAARAENERLKAAQQAKAQPPIAAVEPSVIPKTPKSGVARAKLALAPGVTVQTGTGREITVPAAKGTPVQRAQAMDAWLHTEALQEASDRGDGHVQRAFGQMKPKSLSQIDRTSLNEYLFGSSIAAPKSDLAHENEHTAFDDDNRAETAGSTLRGARDDTGRLKSSLKRVSDDDLMYEYAKSVDANANENTAGKLAHDENFHTMNDGRSFLVGTDASMKAAGRVRSRKMGMEKMEAELTRRGIEHHDAYIKGTQNAKNFEDPTSFSFSEKKPKKYGDAEQTGMFGDEAPAARQESLFTDKAGTEASRDLKHTDSAARAELAQLQQRQPLETNPTKRAQNVQRMAVLSKLVNRGEKISGEEGHAPTEDEDGQHAMFERAKAKYLAEKSPSEYGADAPRFYSRLERAIQAAPFNKGTGAQWTAALSKNVAKGEREWTGVEQFLAENKDKVLTRAQVSDVFDAKKIDLGETTLQEASAAQARAEEEYRTAMKAANSAIGIFRREMRDFPDTMSRTIEGAATGTSRPILEILKQFHLDQNPFWVSAVTRLRDTEMARVAAQKALGGMKPARRPKFAEYTEPGGTNYREVLIRLGEQDEPFDPSKVKIERHQQSVTQGSYSLSYNGISLGGGYDLARPGGVASGKGWLLTDDEIIDRVRDQFGTGEKWNGRSLRPGYNSSHFDEPNILAHVRLKDRTLPNGEKTLFVEEIQSDWHQKGREHGYKPGDVDRQRAAMSAEFDANPQRREALIDEMNRLNDTDRYGVPDAPFKKTEEWMGLAMKHVIDEAVKGGYDRVAWTTGAQQAARYDLSKQVDEIEYNPKNGSFQASKDGQVVHSGAYDAKALPSVIGKEAAQRLLAAPLNRVPHRSQEVQTISGNDLAFGGQGMRSFYDEMLPSWVRDYAKKLGVKIDIEPTSIHPQGSVSDFLEEVAKVMDAEPHTSWPEALGAASDVTLQPSHIVSEAHRALNDANMFSARSAASVREVADGVRDDDGKSAAKNLSFKITPELSEKVKREGQFLMERGKGYSAEQLDFGLTVDGKTVDPKTLKAEDEHAVTATQQRAVAMIVRGIKDLGLPDAGNRRAQIDAATKVGMINPVGRVLRNDQDRAQLMAAFRHPSMEILSAFILDDDGKIVGHSARTSGKLNYSILPKGWTDEIAALAKEVGGTRVEFGHNHPSGDPTPSLDDYVATRQLARELGEQGLTFDGHTIINHDKAARFTFDFDGNTQTKGIRIDRPSPAVWTTAPEGGFPLVRSHHAFAGFLQGTTDPRAVTVFHLDAQNQLIGVEARPAGAIASIHEWLPDAVRAVSGKYVVLGVHDAVALPLAKRVASAQKIDTAGQWAYPIHDVIGVSYGATTTGKSYADQAAIAGGGQYDPDFSDPDAAAKTVRLTGTAPASEQVRRARGAGTAEGGRGLDSGSGRGVRESDRVTNTPAFRRWFGDSKVVDAEGKPLVVYHGTNQDFDRFVKAKRGALTGSVSSKVGFFFTEHPDEAQEYADMSARRQITNSDEVKRAARRYPQEIANAERRGDWDAVDKLTQEWESIELDAIRREPQGHAILPLYLSIQNPLIIDLEDKADLHRMVEAVKQAKDEGHDGVKMLNVFDPVAERTSGQSTTQWIAFEPTQIKSATGNSGAFDPSKPSIIAERPPRDYGDTTPDEPQVGVKNADSAGQRKRFSMDERTLPEPRTQQEMYDAGKAAIERDPSAERRLLDELRDDPERIVGTKSEAGILLKVRVDLEHGLTAAMDAVRDAITAKDPDRERLTRLQLGIQREKIKEFIHLAERTGTATGRALAARKMMSKLDYSLGSMEVASEAAKGASLTQQELDTVKKLHEELKAKMAAVEADAFEARERAAKAESELTHAKMRLEIAGPLADRVTSKLERAAAAAAARLRERGFRAMSGLDPADLADFAIVGAAELARGVRSFGAWSEAMVTKMGGGVKPHLEEIFSAAASTLDKEIASARPGATPRAKKTEEPPKPPKDLREKMRERVANDDADLDDLRPYLQELALEHIRAGVTQREAVLDALHKDVEPLLPDVTREEVRDALSGYGQFRPLNKAADLQRLREIRAESQKLAQLDALKKGESPRATGFERPSPNDETRRLAQQVAAAKKEAGLNVVDDETRLKSALSSAKARVRNQISDLQSEIDTGKRIVAGKHVRISDPELEALRQHLEELRKTEVEVFGKKTMTDEQRLAMATAAAKRSAEAWKDRLTKATSGIYSKTQRGRPLSSAEIDALRAQGRAARAQYEELKSLDPDQRILADEASNVAYRRRLAEREAALLDRMARGDYTPKANRPNPLDAESLKRREEVESVKRRWKAQLHEWERKNRTRGQKIVGAIKSVPGLAKSLKASLDDSALLRQGLRPLIVSPTTWLRNSRLSFMDIARTFGGQEVMDAVNADIWSRPNASLYRRAKLAIKDAEESFPETIQERIPVLGRAFKAADVAFTAFQYRTRADLFDKYVDLAKASGVDLNDRRQIESIGKLVNSLTGRAHLGKIEPAANVVNDFFFSPRSLVAHIDALTAHSRDPELSSFARKQALTNLLKVIGALSAVVLIANALSPGSAETDPRSANFGKIRVKNTRYDFTGGMGSYVTLVARLITGSSKSSTTGRVTPLNSDKFGSQTRAGVLVDFVGNKLSPVASLAKDLLKGKDFAGNKPTVAGEASNFLAPLPITNFIELQHESTANRVAGTLLDAFGIGVNTYFPGIVPAMTDSLRAGQIKREQVLSMLHAGTLTEAQARDILTGAKLGPSLDAFRKLSPAEAVKAYERGTPEEKALWQRVYDARKRQLDHKPPRVPVGAR